LLKKIQGAQAEHTYELLSTNGTFYSFQLTR